MTDFTLTKETNGIATIIWDCEGKAMNIMTIDALQALNGLIDTALADDAIKGIIITSAKPDFAAGMDLNVLGAMTSHAGHAPAQALFSAISNIHAMLRKIERAGMDPKTNKGGKPIASVLPGTALGIGYELPLATHRIFAATNPKAKIGLPEILIGIFPLSLIHI